MVKIFYAIGSREVEDALTGRLGDVNYSVVGVATYRSIVIQKLDENFSKNSEGIVLLNEGLSGKEYGSILELCQQIRIAFPNLRIIMLAGAHVPGDTFLSSLVSLGIYDIVFGSSVNMDSIIDAIEHKNNYANAVTRYLGKNPSDFLQIEEMETPQIMATEEVVVKKKGLFNRRKDKERALQNQKPPIQEREEQVVEEQVNAVSDTATMVRDRDEVNDNFQTTQAVTMEDDDLIADEPMVAKPKMEDSDNVSPMDPPVTPREETTVLKQEEKQSPVSEEEQPYVAPSLKEPKKVSLFPAFNGKAKKGFVELPPPRQPQILSFIGGGGFGIGNREVALNVAYCLAAQSNKVLYIDITNDFPAVLCRLNLNITTDGGIKEFVEYAEQRGKVSHRDIIIPINRIEQGDEDYIRVSRFPETLSFLTHSIMDYESEILALSLQAAIQIVKESKEYEYIVMVCSGCKSAMLCSMLSEVATETFYTLTQSSLSLKRAHELFFASSIRKDNVHLVLNRYERERPSDLDISNLFQVESVYSIPCDNKGFLQADARCLPYTVVGRNRKVLSAIANMVELCLRR